MKIKSIEFKNFVSFGNKIQRLEFPEKEGNFYLVVGSNGAGKSSLSDVMKFGAYGKVGNKRLKDIPNRFNGNTRTKIELSSRNENIIIKRGLSPNFLELEVDGVFYDQAGKKNAEEYIEEEVLGIPFYVFNNIISLSVNDFKSFLSMSPHDKRMIIDKIFGLEIFNTIRWLIREEIKKIKDESLSLLKESEAIDITISNSKNELENLKKEIETNTTETRNIILNNIKKYNDKLEEIKNKIDGIVEKNDKANIKLKDLTEQLNKDKQNYHEVKRKKELYENEKCPECESDLETEFHKNILNECLKKELPLKENIENTTESIKNINKLKIKINDNIILFRTKKAEFNTIISNYNEQLKNLDDKTNLSFQTNSIERIIKESGERKIKVIKKKDIKNNKNNFYKILEDIYGDKGIKQLAITKILPSLNSEIRKVIAELRMNYKVVFNYNFEPEISQLGYDVSIPQLSTGERKKIDFSVLIALIRLMKIKFPSMNIIFLDEIFSSLDADSIHHILKILSDTTKEIGLNIFVVNHAPLPEEIFDYKITMNKPDNFSSLEMVKIS